MEPFWRTIEAKSPQYSDVGMRLAEIHWGNTRKLNEMEKEKLLDYLEYPLLSFCSDIFDLERKIKELESKGNHSHII